MTEKYILRNPIYLEPHDMPPEYFLWDYDSNPDGTVMEFSAKQVDELFQPLDIPAIEKQLEGHLTSFIVNVTEYVDLCDHAQNAEELNAIRGHFNRCQHEHIAEVLAVFGLENKEDES